MEFIHKSGCPGCGTDYRYECNCTSPLKAERWRVAFGDSPAEIKHYSLGGRIITTYYNKWSGLAFKVTEEAV